MALRLLNQISGRYVSSGLRCASNCRRIRPSTNPADESDIENPLSVRLSSIRRSHSQPACQFGFHPKRTLVGKRSEKFCTVVLPEPKKKLKKDKGKKLLKSNASSGDFERAHKANKERNKVKQSPEFDSIRMLCSPNKYQTEQDIQTFRRASINHQYELDTNELLNRSKVRRKSKDLSPSKVNSAIVQFEDDDYDIADKREKPRKHYLDLTVENTIKKINAPWKSFSESMRGMGSKKNLNIKFPGSSASPDACTSKREFSNASQIDHEDEQMTADQYDWHSSNDATVHDLVKKCRAYSNDYEKFKDSFLRGAKRSNLKYTGLLDPNYNTPQNLRSPPSQGNQERALKNPHLKRLIKRNDGVPGRTRSYSLTETEITPRADDNLDVHKVKPLPVLSQQKYLPGMVNEFNPSYFEPDSTKIVKLKPKRAKSKL